MIYAAILLPLAAGALLPVFRFKSMKTRGIYTFLCTLATSLLVAAALITRTGAEYTLLSIMDGFSISFRADGVGSVFAALIAFLWPIAVVYATEYMEYEESPDKFFAFYTLSYGVALAIAFSSNFFTMYVFFECLTIVTLPLVTHKDDPASVMAGRKYVLFSLSGAALGFIALMLFSQFGMSMDFTLGGGMNPDRTQGHELLMKIAYIFAFVGFGTKAAIFPMYSWLPRASVAPTPVTALLHAVAVVNTGVFAVLRVTYYAFGCDFLAGSFAQIFCMLLAAFTVVFASVMAVKEQHLKRRLAYSTIANMSYMLVGVEVMSSLGMGAALLHMVCHSLIKIVLFYCAGAFLVKAKVEYIQQLKGIYRKMPFTCAAFALAAVALSGMPPLCGFTSKWNLLTVASASPVWVGKVGAVALIISAILTAIYMFTILGKIFLASPSAAVGAGTEGFPAVGINAENVGEPTWRMLTTFAFLSLGILAASIYSAPLLQLLNKVASGLIF